MSEEVQIDISDNDFLTLAKQAHENNITFNELVNVILTKRMNEELNLPMETKHFSEKEFIDNFDLIVYNIIQKVYNANIENMVALISIDEYNKMKEVLV